MMCYDYDLNSDNNIMKAFEIRVGPGQESLRLEPQETKNTFKIFALDKAQDWLDRERARSVDVPDDGSLGIITVHSARHFEFNGAGAFTGQDLAAIAAQVVLHPQFKQDS